MKKINIYNIFVILVCLILFSYSIFIGSPIKNNTNAINLFALVIFTAYIITNMIINKKYKIIKNKIDIFVILLVFSSYIALIFKTYSNLEATIEYIIKYTAILSMYIMIRDVVIKDKKYINYIIITLTISSINIFILGLDNITYNIGQDFLNLTGNVELLNQDKRFNSIFGYANTTAIYMLTISILAIGKYLISKKRKEKMFYNVVVFFNMIAIMISYSRATWLIVIIIYFLYVFFMKNKKGKYLEILLRNGILSGIYSIMAIKLINQNIYAYVWLILLLFIGIVCITAIASEKTVSTLRKMVYTLKKIKIRYYVISLLLLGIIVIYLLYIGIHTVTPLEIFKNLDMKSAPTHDINDVIPNTTYTFEFNIDSKVAFNAQDNYFIQICERNKYDDIIKTHEIEFGTYQGIKTIEFTTTKYTCKFLLRFETKSEVAQRGLTVYGLKINGEDEILNYKYLPERLVNKIKDIRLNTISVRGRWDYYIDTVKLIGKYGILGIGADGWEDRRVEVQEYYDSTSEAHSYPLEVFCEFGVLGFIAIIYIFIFILKSIINIIKQKENNLTNTSIVIAILALLVHACIDFDLSFMYMLILFFTLLATMNMKEMPEKEMLLIGQNEHINRYFDNCMKVITIILLIIAIYFDTRICMNQIRGKENPYSAEIIFNQLQIDENFSDSIDKIVDRRKYTSHIDMFEDIIEEGNLTEDAYIKLFDVLKSEKEVLKNDAYGKLREIYMYQYIVSNINQNEQKKDECIQEIFSEIESTKELLNNPEKCRLSLEEITQCEERLKNVYENIIKQYS